MLFSDALHECGFRPGLYGVGAADYRVSLEAKRDALAFLFENSGTFTYCGPRCEPLPVLPSPKVTGYRTTTKRRVLFGVTGAARRNLTSDGGLYAAENLPEADPPEHRAVYKFLATKLRIPSYRPLAEALNWIIIRGTYTYRVVVFSVSTLDARIVHCLKLLAEHLKTFTPAVAAAHVYVARQSDYYLELDRPSDTLPFKQLYGAREVSVKIPDFSVTTALGAVAPPSLPLRFPVTGFSQVNESLLPNLLAVAADLAGLSKDVRFLDLYCGYGLFAFGIGSAAGSVVGADWAGESIECARRSAAYLKRQATFVGGRIDEKFIRRLPAASQPQAQSKTAPMLKGAKNDACRTNEVVLLDPPRKGTLLGVVGAVARRRPLRVVHIFCGTDEIPRSLAEWVKAGYRVRRVQPIDMFPGTGHLETLVELSR